METRVLRYFIKVAELNNLTKAAQQLHVTQPTLSRQIMELEQEVGVKLFDREKHQLHLNDAGVLFQQRAQTILALIDHTEDELQQGRDRLSGTINLGCVESSVAPYMMAIVQKFQEKYPQVSFRLFDGDGDTLRQRIDQGVCDMAALIQPVEVAKYNYLQLPVNDCWGLIMQKDDPLAKKKAVTAKDIYQLPLIIGRRNIVRDDLTDVLKLDPERLNIKVMVNLPENAKSLIESGHYYHLGIKGVFDQYDDSKLAFVPFSPEKVAGHVLAWRKNRQLGTVAQIFLQFITAQMAVAEKRSPKN
ncbi:LysR family transcriptional regulator [Limosilactobacillus secaliphilus]|nr:LysR family transcriptional regulator [Limosilactobacillus secaliphilus]